MNIFAKSVMLLAFSSITAVSASKLNFCPKEIAWSDINKLNKDGDLTTINKMQFSVDGVNNLPNWTNPITKKTFKAVLKDSENEESAMLKCVYEYKTSVMNKTYSFALQGIPTSEYVENVGNLSQTISDIIQSNKSYDAGTSFTVMKSDFKKASIKAHPDRGGNEETMKQLNSQWDNIKEYFDIK